MKVSLKQYSFLFGTIIVFFITIISYNLFSQTEHFQTLLVWSADNLILLCLILIAIKIIGILWPPLPGIVFMIAAIPVIGWLPAFCVDLIGAMIGTCLAFGLSRRYGPRVILKLFGESGLRQVQRFKFKPDREFEAIVLMRVFTGVISELISYGAGLTNIKFRNFFFGTITSSLVVGFPLFYLFHFVFRGENLAFAVIPLVIGISLIYYLRGRYFILED
jgi:uncharacterized membrane protein YdjX (TVP38/TMEM64 family)